MYVSMHKFPVTDTDGTEYRVSIEECDGGYFYDYIRVKLYVKRRRFGFRRVYCTDFYSTRCTLAWRGDYKYDALNVDYIALATHALRRYSEDLAEIERKREEKTRHELRKLAAIEHFGAWDGRIKDGDDR